MESPMKARAQLLALSLAIAVGAVGSAGVAHAEEGIVASFDGEKNATTESFEVRGPWEIVWQTSARRFEIAVLGYASGIPSIIVSRPGDGEGREMMLRSGTFQLQVVADGPWEISIVGNDGGPA